jgi:hypothetical protein
MCPESEFRETIVGALPGRADKGEEAMPAFGPELTHAMRNALEEVMTRVPAEYSTPAMKARLAQCILKAAANGHTTYSELVNAAADQIQAVASLLT